MEYDSLSMIQFLESPPAPVAPVFEETRETFIAAYQKLLELVPEVSETVDEAPAAFAKLSLFASCVDELLVAFHLSQHCMVNQAYAHLRAVLEFLDLMRLFHKYPKWVTLWMREDEEGKKKARNEFQPSRVREKLWEATRDPIYSLFSELGVHATFDAARVRASKLAKKPDPDAVKIIITIPGTESEKQVIFANIFVLVLVQQVIAVATEVFEEQLRDSGAEAWKNTAELVVPVFIRHLAPYSEELGWTGEDWIGRLFSDPEGDQHPLGQGDKEDSSMSQDEKPKKPATEKPKPQKPVKPAQTDKPKPESYVEVFKHTGGETRDSQE